MEKTIPSLTFSLGNFFKPSNFALIPHFHMSSTSKSTHIQNPTTLKTLKNPFYFTSKIKLITLYYYFPVTSTQWICHLYPLWSMVLKFMDFLLFRFKYTQVLQFSYTKILWSSSTHHGTQWSHSNDPFPWAIYHRLLDTTWPVYYPIYSMSFAKCTHLSSLGAQVLLH